MRVLRESVLWEFRENLLFSLYAGFWSMSLLGIFMFWENPLISSVSGSRLYSVLPFLITMSMAPLLGAVYHVFYGRNIRLYWAIAAGITAGAVYTGIYPNGNGVPVILILVSLEIVRVAGLATWRKQEGGRIILAGIGVLVVGLLLNFTGEGFVNSIGDLLIILSVPGSMSLLLGLRFARTNRRLEEQLVQVEELSEKTIAQEQEKAEIIAGQAQRLELEVAQRTAELEQSLENLKKTQSQLVQAEKMASLGSLTAGIAHEIKNPLNFINNFAEVNEELARELEEEIAKGADGNELVTDILTDLKQNASVIAEHGKRADSIVRAMMQHARGGAGERETVDLNALVKEYVGLAYHGKRAQIPDFNAAIEEDYDASVGSISIVPQDIGRVLLNLLGNAFDAVSQRMEGGGSEERAASRKENGEFKPTVAVSTVRNDGQVEIRVSDNGSGVPEKIRSKIFEPFFTTKPTGSGTGVGLSLSYDIVTQGHGGSLRVGSSDTGGAAFVVTLPVTGTSIDSPDQPLLRADE